MNYKQYIKENNDGFYDFYENVFEETVFEVWNEFIKNKNKKQKWRLISKERLFKIWNDRVKFGVVHDERGMDDIVNIMIENTRKLYVNTVLTGHSSEDPITFLYSEIEYKATESEIDSFYDFISVCSNGHAAISDYGLEPLIKLSIQLLDSDDYNEKLVIVDKMLNIYHQRSDLAELFVEGGSSTLQELSN